MQTHYAEVVPASNTTLPQWVAAGLVPINRVSVIGQYFVLHDGSEADWSHCNVCIESLEVFLMHVILVGYYHRVQKFWGTIFMHWPTTNFQVFFWISSLGINAHSLQNSWLQLSHSCCSCPASLLWPSAECKRDMSLIWSGRLLFIASSQLACISLYLYLVGLANQI